MTSGSGAYTIDDDQKLVIHEDGRMWRLGFQEYALLHYLHQNRGKLIPARELLAEVWKDPEAADPRIHWKIKADLVRVTVSNVRKHIAPDVIDTAAPFGYGIGIEHA